MHFATANQIVVTNICWQTLAVATVKIPYSYIRPGSWDAQRSDTTEHKFQLELFSQKGKIGPGKHHYGRPGMAMYAKLMAEMESSVQ